MISEAGLRVHSVTSRVKGRANLERKVSQARGKYSNLDEVTDVLGVRVITYFPDDVDRVANVIEEGFAIDLDNSLDRRTTLDPDRFGYLSLHYVAALSDERYELAEYRRFRGCGFEIQIRSVLQHAWAEIEHDLGYKTTEAVPAPIRRRFARLAGLLELADEEFRQIRDQVEIYQEQIEEAMPTRPEEVGIDAESLLAFIRASRLVSEIDKELVGGAGKMLGDFDDAWETFAVGLTKTLRWLELETLADLDAQLRAHREAIVRFAHAWLAPSNADLFPPGISLFYLGYVLAAQSMSLERLEAYLKAAGISSRGESKQELAKGVLATFTSLTRPE